MVSNWFSLESEDLSPLEIKTNKVKEEDRDEDKSTKL